MDTLTQFQPANIFIAGANRGIGLGFVKALLKQHPTSRIYATYRNLDAAGELMALAVAQPETLFPLPLDITDEAQVMECLERVRSHVDDRLHLALNCIGILHAGALQPEKSLKQIDPQHLQHYFQINSTGAVLLAKHLLPLFRHRDRSIFATISAKIGSIGDNQLGGWYGYRASKAALNMLIRTAAIEYRRKSPHTLVVMLHPGTTDTDLSKPFQRNVMPEQLFPVERTVAQLLAVLDNLQEADSGHFFSWDGSRLPW